MRRALVLAVAALLGSGAAAADSGEFDVDGADTGAQSVRARSGASALPHAAADLEKTLADLRRETNDVEQRFDALGNASRAASARTLLRGRAYVRLARAGLLPVGEGFAALIEHATRLERLRHGLLGDLAEQKRTALERARLARRLSDLKARLAPLEAEQAALSRAESALLSEADRERAFERAFESSALVQHTAVYGALGPSDPSELRGGFAAARGRLPFPIAGRTEIKRIQRNGSEGPGLEMRAPLGTPVRAIYPGRVAFADTYADYGRTVIIDHGNRHYTVSANLSTTDVVVGDEVDANTRIGSVGDSGRGSFVYFEIRIGTETVDPGTWFGI